MRSGARTRWPTSPSCSASSGSPLTWPTQPAPSWSSSVADHPVPSDHARELVRGGFDPHVHVAPDFAPRRITDLELAQRFAELGLAGFGLKSHYTATAERAAVVTAAAPDGVRALGTITLNHAVGGLNATAVEVAARQGARIVWLPTVSSENEFGEVEHADPDGKVPVWARFELEL